MKFLVILCVIGASLAEDHFYSTANDYLDMDSVINDPAQAQSYIDCFLGRHPCGIIAASYLRIIPDSIKHACKRCNPAQKHLANTFLNGLKKYKPDDYAAFVKKFDPEGIYMDKLFEQVKGH